jgi:hypothetical protein
MKRYPFIDYIYLYCVVTLNTYLKSAEGKSTYINQHGILLVIINTYNTTQLFLTEEIQRTLPFGKLT